MELRQIFHTFAFIIIPGLCGADQGSEPDPGAFAGERGGDLRAQGREKQHQGG